MDDSFKRPGRIPFQWEIRPGVPKPQHQPTPAAPSPPTSKLSRPPCMTPPSLSPQWSRSLSASRSQSNAHSPPLPQSLTRSASRQPSRLSSPSSPSPSKATASIFYRSASASPSKRRSDPTRRPSKAPAAAPKVTSVPPGCFPVPALKRKEKHNKRSIFESPHHSASSRSSASFSSPFRGSFLVRDEVEVASNWFF
ncbi:unnamed protein product [Musa acuminata subsp. malaccensis]|uniref:(wild Malaysian banana) hypothetical protein n=1 Tax=Musa acuminata subsp. malaccensis TaxID=214687 RepID=A0A804KUW0_MUSAM|nr:PREDICTED: serine/arginine repetitive matrix protein 1-like [Musa acuminata subsp. malaccensis]CAG1853171.1 unnamed protein product [Musa acuminata subsp. malaccensis]